MTEATFRSLPIRRSTAMAATMIAAAWLAVATVMGSPAAPSQADPYEPNDSFAQAYGPLASNARYSASIWLRDDADYYRLTMTQVGWLEVVVDEASFSGMVEVYNEVNQRYAFAQDSFSVRSAGRVVKRLPPGEFWVVVTRSSGLGGEPADYVLRVFIPGQVTATPSGPEPTPGPDGYEPNDAFAQAFGPIVPGVEYSGAIAPITDHDFFVLEIAAEGSLEVVVDRATFGGGIEIYNDVDQDRPLATDSFSPSTAARTTNRLPAGTFWAVVHASAGRDQTGALTYRLRAFFPAAPTAMPTATPRPTSPPGLLTERSYLPYARKPKPPTATPTPSATPPPHVECPNRIVNGSFEEGGAGWAQDGNVQLAQVRGGSHTGDWAAYFGDRDNAEDLLVSTETLYTVTEDVLESATLRYAVMASTTDDPSGTYDELSVMMVSLDAGGDDYSVVSGYDNLWAAYRPMQWSYYEKDVTRLLRRRAGWSAAALAFFAYTDESLPTGWLIDSVDLHVCYWAAHGTRCEDNAVSLVPRSGQPTSTARGTLGHDLGLSVKPLGDTDQAVTAVDALVQKAGAIARAHGND